LSLKELFKTRQQNGILIPRLNEFLLLEGKKPSDRKTGVFHPSEISGFFCPRQWVIKERHRGEIPVEGTQPGSMRTFEVGHRLHDMMQDYFSQMGLLYGKFECRKCEETYLGFKPTSCQCGKSDFKYREVRIKDDEYHIYGHTDGIVLIDFNSLKKPKKYIFEFKTINPMGYGNLRKEIDDHREQASIYMWTLEKFRQKRLLELEKSGVPKDSDVYKVESIPFDGVIILYMNKGQQPADGLQDLKEYLIPFSEAEKVIEAKYPLLEETWKHYVGGTYPERICGSRTEGHKCKCPKALIDYCFGTLQD
jgi:hypothetical protein